MHTKSHHCFIFCALESSEVIGTFIISFGTALLINTGSNLPQFSWILVAKWNGASGHHLNHVAVKLFRIHHLIGMKYGSHDSVLEHFASVVAISHHLRGIVQLQ